MYVCMYVHMVRMYVCMYVRMYVCTYVYMCVCMYVRTYTVFTRNDAAASINFTAVEGGDNSSYSGSEAREVFINTSSDISGVNK